MNTLKLDLNNPYKLKIEENDDLKTSIFASVYEKANSILENQILKKEDTKKSKKSEDSEEYNNNIIAFSGERGSGKTSTMLSFAKSLDKEKFFVLNMIEPTMLNNNIDVLEVVVAQVLESFKKELVNNDINDIDKRKVLDYLENIYKSLRLLNQPKPKFYENENMENLIGVASAMELKNTLKNTLKKYLEIIEKEKLVILIDDFDLNINNAYDVLERIRKYLILPNVLILISFKKEQLLTTIQDTTEKKINQEKYFEKLFPMDRVLELPQSILNFTLHEDTVKGLISDYEKEENYTVQRIFLKLLKEKCGDITLSDTEEKLILPSTIRSTINQLTYLSNLSKGKNYNQNLIDFSEQLISSSDFIKTIEQYKTMSKSYLEKTNWIDTIMKLDEEIQKNNPLSERKEKLIEKLYLINYLNLTLKVFSKSYPQEFNFIASDNFLNSFPLKKDYKKIDKNLLEFILNFLEDNQLEEIKDIYDILFENNTLSLDNVLKFFQVDYKKLTFETYYKLILNLENNKIVSTTSPFIDSLLIDNILVAMEEKLEELEISFNSKIDINILSKIKNKKIKNKLVLYTNILINFNDDILNKLKYINNSSLIATVEFLKDSSDFLDNSFIYINLFEPLESEEESFNKVIDSIKNFLTNIKIENTNLKKDIRDIEKIKKEIEVNIKENKERINRNEYLIDINNRKIKELKDNIELLKSQEKTLQKSYKPNSTKQTDTLKKSILDNINRYKNTIKSDENSIYSLEIRNSELRLEISTLALIDNSNNASDIVDKLEIAILELYKKLEILIESVGSNFIYDKWKEILEEEEEEIYE